MRRPALPSASEQRPRRRVVGRAVCLLTGFALAAGLAVSPAQARRDDPTGTDPEPEPSAVTMVQANIYTGLTVPRFQADVAEVLALQPDFVTYNEVPFRMDGVIAPEGYDVYRDMRNRFTAATPVVWRTDRWTPIDQGTYRLTNWRGVPPHKKVELGRRFANWVTLQGTDGRVLSVVSAHVAPLTRGMPDLLRRSVKRLGKLSDQLSASGPVLIGGDFNVHYKSGRLPRDLLSQYSLVPTYDTLGFYFPTGDHHGNTIDYVFNRGNDLLVADRQEPVELHSDHDAVVVGLDWTTDPVSDTTVVENDPTGDNAAQRETLRTLFDALKTAPAGAKVELATRKLELIGVVRRVRRALARGVHVQVATASRHLSKPETKLARSFERSTDPASGFHACPECRSTWRDAGMSKSFMMVSGPEGTSWATRYDANRNLTRQFFKRPSQMRISTGSMALAEGQRMLRLLP